MMHIDELLTDHSVLTELGRRLEHHRLQRNRTQAELAEEAGIGRATLQRMERGQPVQTVSLVKVLRTLGLLGGIEALLPAEVELPIAELERTRGRTRRRARGRRGGPRTEPPERTWRWGEEPEAGR